MSKEMIELILKNMIPLAAVLVMVSLFLWSTVLAVVFLITKTRSKKIFGAEFDVQTDRRRK
jgi:hypothetical protein